MAVRLRRPAEGWLSLLLLGIVLFFPVASLIAADWVDNLPILYWLALAGLVLGFVFARIPLPGSLLHPIGLLGGAVVVFYVVASTIPRAPEGLGRMYILWRRLVTWVVVVQRGGFGNQPILFLLLLAELTWVVSYLGAWSVYRRRSAWWPLIAGGAILIINISYAPELLEYVLPFAVASLLLVARLNLYRQELAWQAAGLRYSQSIWSATLRTGLVVSLLIAGFAWYAPEIPPRDEVSSGLYEVSQPARDFQNGFNRLFGGIRSRGGAPPALSGFGNSLTLGGQFRLASYPVLRITSPEERYWRAVVYERYTGQGWVVAQPTTPVRVEAGADLPTPDPQYEQRAEVTQVVEVLQPRGDYLVGSDQPVRVDMTVTAEAFPSPQPRSGTLAPSKTATGDRQMDFVAVHGSLPPGKRYTVVSSVSRATPAMLRQAGQGYPREVVGRYVGRVTVPQRVRDLALELTRQYDNPYDKARAIEKYLRTFQYSLDVAPPPPERDAVDYFLFDLKAGYCDYFASGMAVMLRSVGIPARVVSGYNTGSREGPDGPFIVRDSNAHSWVEVYFPRYGWVEFDPTPSQPLIEHPIGVIQATPTPDESVTPEAGSSVASEQDDPLRDHPLGGEPYVGSSSNEGLRTAAAILVVVALGVLAAMALWRASLAGLPPAAAAYARMAQLASLLRWQPRQTETPHEYAGRLAGLVPGQRTSFRLISDAFVAFRFGHRASTPSEGSILDTAWLNVRRGLLWAAGRRLQRLLRPWRRARADGREAGEMGTP